MRAVPTVFLQARLVALFLLATGALYGAYLGWDPAKLTRPGPLAWPPIAVGVGLFLGAALHDRLSAAAERVGRARLQLLGGVTYGGVLFLGLLGILAGERSAVASSCSLMMVLQPAFLLLAGLGRSHLGTLLNSTAMTAIGALGGGAGAAVAVTAHAAFLVLFLVADHAARKLAEYPIRIAPSPGAILGEGLIPVAAVTAFLGGFFALVPPLPYEPIRRAATTAPLAPGQLSELLLTLGGVAALATLGFYLLVRFGTGRGSEGAEAVAEKVAARGRSEALPRAAPSPSAGGDSGWRGKIVRLYVRMGTELARLGLRRRPDQTPREYAERLAPADRAGELTAIFMGARYGSAEPGEADFRAAQAAAQAVLDRARRK